MTHELRFLGLIVVAVFSACPAVAAPRAAPSPGGIEDPASRSLDDQSVVAETPNAQAPWRMALHTLSASELESFTGKTASGDVLLDWMFRGGYPEIYARDLDPLRFYSDYVATYLERDVR